MNSPVTLLLVEDDELDVMGIQRAFKTLKISNPLVVARDGVEALEQLRGEGGKPRLARPYLILLDLNMPRMNGIEFLQELRKDEALHASVVFVLTTSNADEDIVRAYDQNVAGYIVKADPINSFMEALRLIDCYWTIVELPDRDGGTALKTA